MAVSYDNKIYSVVSVEKDLKSHSKKCFFSSLLLRMIDEERRVEVILFLIDIL